MTGWTQERLVVLKAGGSRWQIERQEVSKVSSSGYREAENEQSAAFRIDDAGSERPRNGRVPAGTAVQWTAGFMIAKGA